MSLRLDGRVARPLVEVYRYVAKRHFQYELPSDVHQNRVVLSYFDDGKISMTEVGWRSVIAAERDEVCRSRGSSDDLSFIDAQV